jgi:hypothetical protein
MSVEPTWHVVAQDALIEEMVAWHGAAPARGEARAYFLAILSALAAAGYAVVRWPPTGDDVQRCADKVNPYAATAEQYSLTVETVCDVIATWMRLAAQEPEA